MKEELDGVLEVKVDAADVGIDELEWKNEVKEDCVCEEHGTCGGLEGV